MKNIILCDVEKAFLQIVLQTNVRNVVCFLWLKNIDKPVTKENIKIYRFTRVLFGVIASPFLLSATIRHHLKIKGNQLAKEIKDNIYVDNIIMKADSLKKANEVSC